MADRVEVCEGAQRVSSDYLEPPNTCKRDQCSAQDKTIIKILAPAQFEEQRGKRDWMAEEFSWVEPLSKQLTQRCQNRQLWVNPWLQRERERCESVLLLWKDRPARRCMVSVTACTCWTLGLISNTDVICAIHAEPLTLMASGRSAAEHPVRLEETKDAWKENTLRFRFKQRPEISGLDVDLQLVSEHMRRCHSPCSSCRWVCVSISFSVR